MRPKERRDGGQTDLLRFRQDAIIDMDHALVKLARTDRLAVSGAKAVVFPHQRFGAVYGDKPAISGASSATQVKLHVVEIGFPISL
jgi:hypothetical protein